MTVDLEDQLDDPCLEDDESVNASAHKDLLGAVSQLYEKKRVKASTRNEPSVEVSEFHLSQLDKKQGGRVNVTDLANVLKKRTTHLEIGQKLQTARRRAKTLPKPLEKFHADKKNREAGYEQAKQQLSRWDAIVYQQRVAETVTFPLPKSDALEIYENKDIKQMFRKPTELELKLAEVLNQPDPLDLIREQKKREEEDFPLSIEEIIEKRKMLAKIRARQSYKDAKAAWKNKIKSKTFRKIERKARAKEQLKEFEEMQKKDPEAALKKLEELERARAEERMTQRHGSTGQWAKGKAIRARYDKEARIALSEQLSKKRELTMKLAKHREESEAEEEEVAENEPVTAGEAEEDPNNPWVLKRSKEMEDFVSGYRKYWETQGKLEESAHKKDTAVKVQPNNANKAECSDKEINNSQSVSSSTKAPNSDENPQVVSEKVANKPKSNVENTHLTNSTKKTTVGIKSTSVKLKKGSIKPTLLNVSTETPMTAPVEAAVGITKAPPAKTTLGTPELVKKSPNSVKMPNGVHEIEKSGPLNVSINNDSHIKNVGVNKNLFVVNQSPLNNGKGNIALDRKLHNFTVSNTKVKSTKSSILPKSSGESSSKLINDAGSWTVNKVIKNMNKKGSKVSAKSTASDELGNKYKVTVQKKSPNSVIGSSRTLNSSSSFVVCKIDVDSKYSNSYCKSPEIVQQEGEEIKNNVNKRRKRSRKAQNKNAENSAKSLDDMFSEAENKLNQKIQRKIEKLSENLDCERKESESESESNADGIPSLEMKRRRTRADIDEPLIERTGDNREVEKTNVEQNLKLASAPVEELRPSKDIDPNKFIKVKPRHLSSELPEIMSEGEDALDDEEKTAEERHLTISEAFADDNVVDEFQKEKEEEGKKSKVKDVDMSLPGWGSWAGHNISSSSKSARRKRKKFVIKIPLAPRRDKSLGNIIVNEDAEKPLKEHQVSTVPFPYTTVSEFEASMRAPIGSTWVPQRAFRRLTWPEVVTQVGAIIEPMDEDQLVKPASCLSPNIKRSVT